MVPSVVVWKYVKILFCKDWLRSLNIERKNKDAIIYNLIPAGSFREILWKGFCNIEI